MTNPHCDHPGHTSRYALFSPFSDPVPVPLPVCHQCEPCGYSSHNGTGHHSAASLTGSTRQPSWRVMHPAHNQLSCTVADVANVHTVVVTYGESHKPACLSLEETKSVYIVIEKNSVPYVVHESHPVKAVIAVVRLLRVFIQRLTSKFSYSDHCYCKIKKSLGLASFKCHLK